uniref:Zinc finger protein 26 n=1 Tax=Cacopsylla melanoneura TaxID=428564 RepID=A0A8D8WX45_9HEMI
MSQSNEILDDVKKEKAVYTVRSEDLVKASDEWDDLRCQICGILSESLTLAFIHFIECKKRGKNKIYECTSCGKTYKERKTLVKHLNYKHNLKIREQNRKEKFECNYCSKIFKYKREIQAHIEIHMNISILCDLCGAKYNKRAHLLKHIRHKHLGLKKTKEKIFSCSFCSRIYRHKYALRDHETCHRIGKLMCQLCSRSYCSKASLTAHIQTSHAKQNMDEKMVKKFVCDVCGNGYTRKCGLKEHRLRQHEGGKISCKICGKEVYDEKSLKIHMNTHTGDKPHSCEICGKSFTTAPYLKVHMYSHTGEAPHVCHLCPQKFRQRSSYTSHYKTHHPGVVPPKLKYTVQEYLQRKHESTSK